MAQRIAYVNGQFLPEDQASISIFDRGLRWGDGVYDVERTFHHIPFELEAHMERLYRTLRYVRIRPPVSRIEMQRLVEELARRNSPCFEPEEDFELCQIVTRGTIQEPERPNVVMYCQELDWASHAEVYEHGVRLITASTRRVPPQCLSPNAKVGNKMHLMIAAEEARAADARALALVLDLEGKVAESSSHNFFFVAGGVLRTPSLANCLPGISRAVTMRLAREEGIPCEEGSYTVFDVYNGEEAFLTSTGPCIVPVSHLDGIRLGTSVPGPVTKRLMEAWNRLAGLDIVSQAQKMARTRGRLVVS